MLEVHPSLFGILACVHCDALKTLHVWLCWASRCRLTARLCAFKGEAPLLCPLYRASASPSQPRATKSLPTPRWEAAVVGLGTSAHVNEQLCRRWQHLASGSIRAHSMRFIQDLPADHGPLLPRSRAASAAPPRMTGPMRFVSAGSGHWPSVLLQACLVCMRSNRGCCKSANLSAGVGTSCASNSLLLPLLNPPPMLSSAAPGVVSQQLRGPGKHHAARL